MNPDHVRKLLRAWRSPDTSPLLQVAALDKSVPAAGRACLQLARGLGRGSRRLLLPSALLPPML